MVKIRLRRIGAKKAPFYRVVVADSRFARDGQAVAGQWRSAHRYRSRSAQEREHPVITMEERQMQELLIAVARGLVENKDAVQVTVDPAREDGTVVYHLTVAEEDMGRVIGKQGRIAKAIRVVMRAAAVRQNEKAVVEIG